MPQNYALCLRHEPGHRWVTQAGAQMGDTFLPEASEEEDLFTAALHVHHTEGCRAGGREPAWPRSPTRSNARLRATCPGRRPVATEPPPGTGEWVPPGSEAALRQLALRPGWATMSHSGPACAGLPTYRQQVTAARLPRLPSLRCRRKPGPTI